MVHTSAYSLQVQDWKWTCITAVHAIQIHTRDSFHQWENFAVTMNKLYLQGSTNIQALGLVNFVPPLAYHFCLNLPAASTQPGARLLVEPCTVDINNEHHRSDKRWDSPQ